jgi:hypothetical protein
VGLQIVCVERKGKKPGHHHVTAIGVDTSQVIIRFSVKTVRRILKRGTVDFYALGGEGEPVRVRRFTCRCGAKTIRTGRDDTTDGVLSLLPACPSPADPGPSVPGQRSVVTASGLIERSDTAPGP